MMAVTEPGVHIITLMVCTQLMKTAFLENIVGFHAHLDPRPMLLVQPKDEAVEAFSKERIGPLIKSTPVLRKLIGTKKTRSAEETLTYKAFPGGFLAMVGAGSPDNLARRPVSVTLYDEVDKYVVTREGDAIGLGDERQATFPQYLSVRTCSPTIAGESRIESSYLEGDQRQASVECPHCGHRNFLEFFRHVDWKKDYNEAGAVVAHLSLGFSDVVGSLRDLGYRTKAGLFTAREAGARHRRRRLFILAHADRVGRGLHPGPHDRGRPATDYEADRRGARERGAVQRLERGEILDGDVAGAAIDGMDAGVVGVPLFAPGPGELHAWQRLLDERPDTQPALLRVDDGMADRVERSRGAGNGVCSLAAARAWAVLKTAHRLDA